MDLQEIRLKIQSEFNYLHVLVDADEIIIEQEYEMSEDENNSDDCCDLARETGEMLVEKFPMLEISEYYCHRYKYAIVNLKKKNFSHDPN